MSRNLRLFSDCYWTFIAVHLQSEISLLTGLERRRNDHDMVALRSVQSEVFVDVARIEPLVSLIDKLADG
jgi:hypothetical protein